jgi:hypothetical protein
MHNEMPMHMMPCPSFSCGNTRGVTSFPPIKESRPEIEGSRVSNGKGNTSQLYFQFSRTEQGVGVGVCSNFTTKYINFKDYGRLRTWENVFLRNLQIPM